MEVLHVSDGVLKVRVWETRSLSNIVLAKSLSTFGTAVILTMKRHLVLSSERALWTKGFKDFSCDGKLRANADGHAHCGFGDKGQPLNWQPLNSVIHMTLFRRTSNIQLLKTSSVQST
jgi:hypothetical protein